jgi:hypothetical protein
LYEIRRVTLEQFSQLTYVTLDFDLDRFVRLDMFVTDGKFHVRTCRKSCERGGGQGSADCTTPEKSIAACKAGGNGDRNS